jgi:hypothetical protein
MKIICIIHEPYIDKIPSLKTLLTHLSNNGFKIIIITSYDPNYPPPSFLNENIQYITVKKRTKVFELATTIKMFFLILKYIGLNDTKYFIGGDMLGNMISYIYSHIFFIKHLYFCLEYPQIPTQKVRKLTMTNKIENFIISRSSFIVTHDYYHKEFLIKYFKVKPDKVFLLPNSTSGKPNTSLSNSALLNKMLKIPKENTIILHSGGLGDWFSSFELAESTKTWEESYTLVFHTSHNVCNDAYYTKLAKAMIGRSNIIFSTTPVNTSQLDTLISSADIGIAWYSVKILDYRATLMGLAAGKIGNYLKCGLPIITQNFDSFRTYIEVYQCGICVSNFEEIFGAIKTIESNYDFFSKNAYRCYEEVWEPTQYLDKILNMINSNIL